MKILIATPVRNRAWVLEAYLQSLKELDTEGHEVYYLFLENGSTDETPSILNSIVVGPDAKSPLWENAVVVSAGEEILNLPAYQRGVQVMASYDRMRLIRDWIRTYAIGLDVDYVFCVDTDIMLRPDTLKVLLAHEKDFVAAMVFNTSGMSYDICNAVALYPRGEGPYSDQARWGGWYPLGYELSKVGGTGAVYLMNKKALGAASYVYTPPEDSRYFGIECPGEDLSFAVSCADAGIEQYLDETHRVWHCLTPRILEIYTQARSKFGVSATETLAERVWAGITNPEQLVEDAA